MSNRSRKAYPLALVLSPTRELTMQIYQEARKEWFYIFIGPNLGQVRVPLRISPSRAEGLVIVWMNSGVGSSSYL